MLIARSSPECHLYIELHPCECAETRGPTEHWIESRSDALVAVYDGSCPKCSRARRFEFALDPEIPPGGKFGGAKSSQIIDAGQFFAVADSAARAVPVDASHLDVAGRQRARSLMNRAVAALEEVLKFIPPDADRVPAGSLFSVAGKEIYLAEPGRFRRTRIEAVLGVYRNVVAELS